VRKQEKKRRDERRKANMRKLLEQLDDELQLKATDEELSDLLIDAERELCASVQEHRPTPVAPLVLALRELRRARARKAWGEWGEAG